MRGHSRVLLAAATVLASLAVAAPIAQAATGYTNISSFASGPGSDAGELSSPRRIAVDDDTGDIYVVDSGNDRVQVFSVDGSSATFLTEITGFQDPYGIAIDQTASPISVYVSDGGTGKIVKLDSDGAPVPTFTPDATFVSPAKGTGAGKVGSFQAPLAVDPSSQDLLVGDPGKNLVQRFDENGAFISDLDGSDSPGGAFTGLLDIAVDPTGRIYVVDSSGDVVFGGGSSRVERFGPGGSYQVSLNGLNGEGLVTVDTDTGNVVVAYDLGFFAGPKLGLFQGDEQVGFVRLPEGVNGGALTGLAFDGGASKRLYAATDVLAECCGVVGVQVHEAQTLPDVTLDPPSGATATSAELAGSVNPLGQTVTARFEYSTDGQSWNSLSDRDESTDPGLEGGSSPVFLTDSLSGLSPGTEYSVRLVANGPGGSATSEVRKFTTDPAVPPTATVDPVDPGARSADFVGHVNPNGFDAHARFEISDDGGTTWRCLRPAESDPCPFSDNEHPLGSGTEPVQVNDGSSDLLPNRDYEVRLVAHGEGGETVSDAVAFHTDASAPIVVTLGADSTTTQARLAGTVNPSGQQTSYYFELSEDAGFSNPISVPASEDADAGSGANPITVSERVEGLVPDTEYHYRLVAQNATGLTEGDVFSLQTDAAEATPPPVRGLEKVSPGNKNGFEALGRFRHAASLDGERVIFGLLGTGPGAEGGAPVSTYVASRKSNGEWDPGVPIDPVGFSELGAAGSWSLFSSDLTRGVGNAKNTIIPNASDDESRVFMRDSLTGERQLLSPVGSTDPTLVYPVGGTPELDHVVFESRFLSQTSDPVFAARNVYEWDEGELRLVNVMPDPDGPGPLEGEATTHNAYLGSGQDGSENAISADGRRIFFTALADLGETDTRGDIYVREDGEVTRLVSVSQRSVPDPAGHLPAGFLGAEPRHGGKVLFSSCEKLTDDSTANYDINPGELGGACGGGTALEKGAWPTNGNGSDLYLYDLETEELTDLTTADPRGGDIRGVVGYSDDMSRVYFVAGGVLDEGAERAKPNLYLWDAETGEVRLVAILDQRVTDSGSRDATMWELGTSSHERTVRVSPDGRYLALTSYASLTGEDNFQPSSCLVKSNGADEQVVNPGLCSAVYLFDADKSSLQCLSCSVDARAPKGDSRLNQRWSTLVSRRDELPRNLADDGSYVFFETPDPLVSGDTNGSYDVYRWEGGRAEPISNENGGSNSFFVDAGESGRDAFFLTRDRSVPQDHDNLVDLYDARVGGGAPPPPPTPSPCEGDACLVPPQVPNDATPATAVANGPGNLKPKAQRKRRACKKGKVRKNGRCVKRHKHEKGRGK